MKLLNTLAVPAALLVLTGCQSATHHHPSPPVAHYPAPPPPPSVPPSHRPPPPPQHAPAPRNAPASEPWVDVSITTSEREVIQGYMASYVTDEKHPGKGRKGKGLPPGLQKKVDRGG